MKKLVLLTAILIIICPIIWYMIYKLLVLLFGNDSWLGIACGFSFFATEVILIACLIGLLANIGKDLEKFNKK
jgi:hypothetical protein